MSKNLGSKVDVPTDSLAGMKLDEWDLFQELKGLMEKEVTDMPYVATRRMFLQRIATKSAVVPASVLFMAMDTNQADACWTCTLCVQCITDICIFTVASCNGCLNCVNQGRAGCQDGRDDGNAGA